MYVLGHAKDTRHPTSVIPEDCPRSVMIIFLGKYFSRSLTEAAKGGEGADQEGPPRDGSLDHGHVVDSYSGDDAGAGHFARRDVCKMW